MAKRGLYANIHAKRMRIKKGSGEKMRKPGAKGAPTAENFRRAAKTANKKASTKYQVDKAGAKYQRAKAETANKKASTKYQHAKAAADYKRAVKAAKKKNK